MSEPIHIIAYGARTPLGLDAASSCAAVSANITRFEEHPFIVDRIGEPVLLAQDHILEPDLPNLERFKQLAKSALDELFEQLEPIQAKVQSVPVYLGLPEPRPGWNPENAQAVCLALAQEDYAFTLEKIKPVSKGHAAGLCALQKACDELHSGKAHVCIVAGVDSYINIDTLGWLDDNKQLATSYHRGAFFPGEGAGAFAIAPESVVKRLNLNSLATIQYPSIAIEQNLIKTDSVCTGDGLTESIRNTVSTLNSINAMVEGIICDINGERYRGEEWGFTLLRLAESFVDPTDYEIPASCWGDMGAASAPLFVILAVVAGLQSSAKGNHYLIWNSSEAGTRAATLLNLPLEEAA
ncbi:MAG: hypothetical protein OEZ68_16350 [Gammaproteobacteria bacterium]|nr:hypothetical protein [Gammaproteobacteria bacterium]MDH5802373.1 hypothetical protein [Gammaproteobacteria bacterium]